MDHLTRDPAVGSKKKKYRCDRGHVWDAAPWADNWITVPFDMPDGTRRTFERMCVFCIVRELNFFLKPDVVGTVEEVPNGDGTPEGRA